MKFESEVPQFPWAEALHFILSLALIINWFPIPVLQHISPTHRLFHENPNPFLHCVCLVASAFLI